MPGKVVKRISANVNYRGTMPSPVFAIRQLIRNPDGTFVICFPPIVLPT